MQIVKTGNKAPRVSIVMPTYNGARYLRESVDSCLNQTFRDLELIVVVDKRTTDSTLDILKQFDDNRMRVEIVDQPGQANALNYGFSVAKGEFYTWTHDDNAYLPTAIEAMVSFLGFHANVHMVITLVDEIDEAGKHLSRDTILIACFLYRASCAKQLGEYDHRFDLVQDSHYWFRMAHEFGPAPWIKKSLYLYRKHADSETSTKGAERALVSLKMHADLAHLKIYPYSKNSPKSFLTIRQVFVDRLKQVALHRRLDLQEKILNIAEEYNYSWAGQMRTYCKFLNSRPGWILNRIERAGIGIWRRTMPLLYRKRPDALFTIGDK